MTIQKAIRMQESIKRFHRYDEEVESSCDMAISVLKKQLPKKPIYEGDGYAPDGTFIWDEWLCPNCGSTYEVDYDKYDHCPNCGQKIDWSDTD